MKSITMIALAFILGLLSGCGESGVEERNGCLQETGVRSGITVEFKNTCLHDVRYSYCVEGADAPVYICKANSDGEYQRGSGHVSRGEIAHLSVSSNREITAQAQFIIAECPLNSGGNTKITKDPITNELFGQCQTREGDLIDTNPRPSVETGGGQICLERDLAEDCRTDPDEPGVAYPGQSCASLGLEITEVIWTEAEFADLTNTVEQEYKEQLENSLGACVIN